MYVCVYVCMQMYIYIYICTLSQNGSGHAYFPQKLLREGSRLTKDSQTARGQTLASTCCTAQLTASLLVEFDLVLACELKPVPIEIQPTLECFLNT